MKQIMLAKSQIIVYNSLTINVASWQSGIYFWRVFDENRQIGQGKLVVLEN